MIQTPARADQIPAIDHAEAMRLTETENARLLAQLRQLTADRWRAATGLHRMDGARGCRAPHRLGPSASQPD